MFWEENFPQNLEVEISENSVFPSQWGRRLLETWMSSCRAGTWTQSLEGTLLASGRESGSSEGPGAFRGGLNYVASVQELEG